MSRSSEKECAKLLGTFRCFKGKQNEEQYNSTLNCCLTKEHTRFKVFSSIKALDSRLVVGVCLQGLLDSNHTNYCNDIRRVTRWLCKESKEADKVACLFELWKEAEGVSWEEAGWGKCEASVGLIESVIVFGTADIQVDRFTKTDEGEDHKEQVVTFCKIAFLVYLHVHIETIHGLNYKSKGNQTWVIAKKGKETTACQGDEETKCIT